MPGWIWIPIALLGLPLLAIALWLAAAHVRYTRFHRREGIVLPPFRAGEAVRYYIGILFSLVVAGWWRIRARGRDGLRMPSADPVGPPVLCVHGFLMDGTGFWGIRRRLEQRGRSTRAVFLGRARRPLEGYAPALATALNELLRDSREGTVDVVAHSMGGLVLRLMLAQEPALAPRIRRIVTLGAPHRGTPVSASLPVGPEVLQMDRGSSFLAALPELAATAPAADVTTIAAGPDLVVYPRLAAHLSGSHRVDLPGVGHLGLLTDRRAIDAVVDALCGPGRRGREPASASAVVAPGPVAGGDRLRVAENERAAKGARGSSTDTTPATG